MFDWNFADHAVRLIANDDQTRPIVFLEPMTVAVIERAE